VGIIFVYFMGRQSVLVFFEGEDPSKTNFTLKTNDRSNIKKESKLVQPTPFIIGEMIL
jgi:hypothetical protein